LVAAAVVNTSIVVVEAVTGSTAHSISLIMDGVHNASDELALVCLCLAYFVPLGKTRGLQQSANLLNSLGLIAISAIVAWQAIERALNPTPVAAVIPIIVGILAAAANGLVAWLLHGVRHMSSAIRLAYLHNVGDVWVSLGPSVAGLLVGLTNMPVFDPFIGLAIAVWIIWSTIKEIVSGGEALLLPEEAVCVHSADPALSHA
jgi:cobalt-zinc-cadmium efflux system protein